MNNMVTTIGNIAFSEPINEVEISRINNRFKPNHIGECKVEVYAGEGSIPHFHIVGVNTDFDCCVRIYDNHFFEHGIHRDTLNAKQCQQLHDWLKRTNDRLGNKSNWKTIVTTWEDNNPNCVYPANKKCSDMPDYSKMKNFRAGM